MRNTVTDEEMIEYLFKKTGFKINNNSVLFDDLHIDGLDLDTLLEDLSKDFNLNFDKFDYRKYYLSEAEVANIFLHIYNGIFRRKKSKNTTFKLQHLLDVVNKGAWFDPK